MEEKNRNSKYSPVAPNEKMNWWSISLIWSGSSICVPAIMVGAMLITEISMLELILSILIGTGIGVTIGTLQSTAAVDLGLPTAILAKSSFGDKGAQFIISFILAGTLICWTGSDCQIAGESFIQILSQLDLTVNREVTVIILGIIMLTVAILGEKILSKLNYIAVPALIILCTYGVFSTAGDVSVIQMIKDSTVSISNLFAGTTMVIGMMAVGTVISPDYHRFIKTRKESLFALTCGFLPTILFLFISGAIMGTATGQMDISLLVADLGLPFVGLIVLVLATWTTLAADAYTGGISITSLFNMPENRRSLMTAVAGTVGIVLAVLGFMDYFTSFIDLLATCIPPIAGVMIVDYFALKKLNKDAWEPTNGVRWQGMVSLVIGVAAAFLIKIGIPSVVGIICSGLSYYIISKLTAQKEA